jgi:hypothetical protein
MADHDEMSPSEAAASLARLGGSRGGLARAASLTPERRSEIAQIAGLARWNSQGAARQLPQRQEAPAADAKHPLIAGLMEALPSEGSNWDHVARARWLTAAAAVFDLLYSGNESGETITISSGETEHG